jgi:hypothetical protein
MITLLFSCQSETQEAQTPIKIAFLADIHLQDIYAQFPDTDYKGLLNPETGTYNTIRTMGSQLRSTRLFNENYFALFAALDDVVAKDIKVVVLPGDFSDDGQPMAIKALKKILDRYSQEHGMQFFLTTGNHDPVRPFAQEAGKTDFLGAGGRAQAIFSDSSLIDPLENSPLPPVITKEIQKWGYLEITNALSDFGFHPRKEFIYWETPYANYNYDEYTFGLAKSQSNLEKRVYQPTGSATSVPDATYLVEPIQDIWLLAIDGNVYIPKENATDYTQNSSTFSGASVGYNHVLDYKEHLISWVKKIAEEAKERGKQLIAFSHYPMVEFNDGASEELKSLFGPDKMQAHRVPKKIVSEIFADAGVKIHFGGHMHLNDTGVHRSKKGNTLFNIQVPSLAAYPSAFKIATLQSHKRIEIETVLLDTVPDFNSLFSLYDKEHEYLQEIKDSLIWNEAVLNTTSYGQFTELHLKELVRLRFLPHDWPLDFRTELTTKTGRDSLLLNTKDITMDTTALKKFETWSGLDMIFDFYQLRSADELAKKQIGEERLSQYQKVCSNLIQSGNIQMGLWGNVFLKSMNGEPSDHFSIDLEKGTLKEQ